MQTIQLIGCRFILLEWQKCTFPKKEVLSACLVQQFYMYLCMYGGQRNFYAVMFITKGDSYLSSFILKLLEAARKSFGG